MWKLTAGLLIVASCSALGFIKAASYRRRRQELEAARQLIKLLRLEISYRKDSLAAVFSRVSAQKSCWFADVLALCGDKLMEEESLSKAWEESLSELADNCPLNDEDISILMDVSLGLGRSDTAGQSKLLNSSAERIEAAICLASEAERRQGRMYRGLGIGAGIVLAILLL